MRENARVRGGDVSSTGNAKDFYGYGYRLGEKAWWQSVEAVKNGLKIQGKADRELNKNWFGMSGAKKRKKRKKHWLEGGEIFDF